MKPLIITLLAALSTLTFAQDFNAAVNSMIAYEDFYFLEQACPNAVSDALRAARCGLVETIDPQVFREQFDTAWQQNTTEYSVVLPWQVEGSSILAVWQHTSNRRQVAVIFNGGFMAIGNPRSQSLIAP
jgi:hypothetical protein